MKPIVIVMFKGPLFTPQHAFELQRQMVSRYRQQLQTADKGWSSLGGGLWLTILTIKN